eukprot:364394-Chlamydomonas_euryale.AAC.1
MDKEGGEEEVEWTEERKHVCVWKKKVEIRLKGFKVEISSCPRMSSWWGRSGAEEWDRSRRGGDWEQSFAPAGSANSTCLPTPRHMTHGCHRCIGVVAWPWHVAWRCHAASARLSNERPLLLPSATPGSNLSLSAPVCM